jgi:hypothetical protein
MQQVRTHSFFPARLLRRKCIVLFDGLLQRRLWFLNRHCDLPLHISSNSRSRCSALRRACKDATQSPSEPSTTALHSKNGVYPEGFLERSGDFRETSGNIRLNTSPLILSGSSFGESFGWASSLLAEDSEPGGVTSSGIIATPYTSTKAANFEHTQPVCSSRPL